ncbi:MAG: hypothetical protein U1E78_02825 [Gammaproteobacteria bacterium]
MIFRVGAERSRRRSVHKVHDCDENREGNNPENSAVKGIPADLGNWKTQYNRFNRWAKYGHLNSILETLKKRWRSRHPSY